MSFLFLLPFSSNETTMGFVQSNLPEKMLGIQGQILEVTGYCLFSDSILFLCFDFLKVIFVLFWFSGWIPEIERHKMVEDPYVFLEYNDTLTSYRRNSSSRWPSCFESAVAAGRSLCRWFRCRETSWTNNG